MIQQKPYCVATIANDRYIKGVLVTLFSFLDNNIWFTGDIVIYSDNDTCKLSNENKTKLNALYPKIIYKEAKPSDFDKIIKHFGNRINPRFINNFYKLYTFGLEEYRHVLFLDSDVIVLGTLEPLFEEADEEFFRTVPSNRTIVRKGKFPRMRKEEIFNGGVFLIAKPSHETEKEIFEFGAKMKFSEKYTGKYADQDILNAYMLGKPVKLFSPIYNDCRSGFKIDDSYKNSRVIHYLGPIKPWSEFIPAETQINLYIWNEWWKRYKEKHC